MAICQPSVQTCLGSKGEGRLVAGQIPEMGVCVRARDTPESRGVWGGNFQCLLRVKAKADLRLCHHGEALRLGPGYPCVLSSTWVPSWHHAGQGRGEQHVGRETQAEDWWIWRGGEGGGGQPHQSSRAGAAKPRTGGSEKAGHHWRVTNVMNQ